MAKLPNTSYANWCIHFRGLRHQTCEAGVDWRALVGGPDFGIARRAPCLQDNNSEVACAHCRYPTPEEVQAHEDAMEAHMERLREDAALIGAMHAGQTGTSVVYVCELCDRANRFTTRTPNGITEHLFTAHELPADVVRTAQGSLGVHMDATDWFQNDDKFTLPDGRVILLRSTRMPRRGSNKAAWQEGTRQRRSRK